MCFLNLRSTCRASLPSVTRFARALGPLTAAALFERSSAALPTGRGTHSHPLPPENYLNHYEPIIECRCSLKVARVAGALVIPLAVLRVGPLAPPTLAERKSRSPRNAPQRCGALFRPRRFAIELCSIPAHLFLAHARGRGRPALIARPRAPESRPARCPPQELPIDRAPASRSRS